MGRAFLVRTTAGLQQPSKDRGKTEHGLRGKLMGYGITVSTTAGSRELSKDRGQLAWVFINRNKIIIITIHSIVGSSSIVVSCEYVFAFSKKASAPSARTYSRDRRSINGHGRDLRTML
jgi:hypothetical protein